MKNAPSVEKVLKWAKTLGLCGPISDNLQRFLLQEERDGKNNLERIFDESQASEESFSVILRLEFTCHLLEEHFQVAV